ncbi:MAG: hypothetical protein JO116_16215 [Planctomycetaceae bacterium]|nr:hypothetical protein [Planctomycetaceae bacterium]
MSSEGRGILVDGNVTAEAIRRAMGEAIFEAPRAHQRAGFPAATMRDGKVVLVPPDVIAIPDEDKSEDDPKRRNGY